MQKTTMKYSLAGIPGKEKANGSEEWICDPADEEPDDSEVEAPRFEPDKIMERKSQPEAKLTAPRLEAPISAWKEKINRLEEEKERLTKKVAGQRQELAVLQHTHLTVQRDAAAKEAELLAQAAQNRKDAEAKISALKEDISAQKHLASERIKELEERNNALEQQLIKAQEKYNIQTEELTNIQHAIQDLRESANKKGTQQALELLDAQGQREKLSKTIHEKDLEIMEAKEKQQELLEKYNAALQRIGEIIGKVLKARERMKEISADFDVYLDAEDKEPDVSADAADFPAPQEEATATELSQNRLHALNPETVEILGTPVGTTPSVPEAVIKEQATKPSLWRRIASLF